MKLIELLNSIEIVLKYLFLLNSVIFKLYVFLQSFHGILASKFQISDAALKYGILGLHTCGDLGQRARQLPRNLVS